MTPTQQALALDALQSIVEQHDGYCEHHIGASTLSFALAHTASDALAAIASLEAAPAAPEFADKTITAREVARQAFALCEWFEDLPDGAQDSQEEARFKAGQRFSAKRIRNGIGTWLTDEENARKQLAVAAPAAVAEPAAQGVTVEQAEDRAFEEAADRNMAGEPPHTEPSAEVVLPEPAVWKITTKNGNVIYETATPEDVYTSQWLAICNVSPLYTAEQVRAARGVKP